MKHLLITILVLTSGFLAAQNKQDTIYLTSNFEITKSIDSAKYYQVIKEDKGLYFVSEYFAQSDSIKMTGTFKDVAQTVKEGEFVYYKKGIVSSRDNYQDGKMNGESHVYYDSGELFYTENYLKGNRQDLMVYYKNGVLKRKEIYTGDKMYECYKPNGEKAEFYEFMVQAVYPNGGFAGVQKYIFENLRYPGEAVDKGIMGKVIIGFSVSKTGEITNVKVRKSVHPLLDAEAIRIVKSMPKWTPGMLDGETVDSYFSLPINFNLKD